MASPSGQKLSYVYFEKKVRNEDEIHSLLFEDDAPSEEPIGEWVVTKSAKKSPPISRTVSTRLTNKELPGEDGTVGSPVGKCSVLVSPIKIKRKLSYSVNKVNTPSKKRPDMTTASESRSTKKSPRKHASKNPTSKKEKKRDDSESGSDFEFTTPSKRKKTIKHECKDDISYPTTPRSSSGRKMPTRNATRKSSESEEERRPARTPSTRRLRKNLIVVDDSSGDDVQLSTRKVLHRSQKAERMKVLSASNVIRNEDDSDNDIPISSEILKKSQGEKENAPHSSSFKKATPRKRDVDSTPTKRVLEQAKKNALLKERIWDEKLTRLESLIEIFSPEKTKGTPTNEQTLSSSQAISKLDATPEKGVTPAKDFVNSISSTPPKGATPSKSQTPAKPQTIYLSSSDEEEAATPLKRSYRKRLKEPVATPARVLRDRTPLKIETPTRRSARISMSPSTPSLRQKVLLANTPRSSLPPVRDELEPEDDLVTPRKTPQSARKKLDLTPSTPLSNRKVGHGFLSPVVPDREGRTSTPSSALGVARAQLQVSTLPSSLPCREKEFNDIESFISRKIRDRTGGCMYVSGVPGTGKTATVHTVVRSLQKSAEDGEISSFDFVEVNGLRLTEPRQAYVRIWQALSKNKVAPDQALKNLENKFHGKPKRCTILLVDELDYLCNRRQDVIYNILDWTTYRCSKLVVLTIANTMDLPERTLKGKVTSRMGLTRLVFQPYTYQQLEQIVLNRLDGCKAFNADAVQLVARKVAAVSGDARRALDICRRSTEILELEGRSEVSVLDIQKVLTQIFAGSRVQSIKNCSLMAKLILRAIRDEVLRTGIEETTIAFVHPQLVSLCALEGKKEPSVTALLKICSNLADSGLIFAEKGRKDINSKISLNISPDDIHYAIEC